MSTSDISPRELEQSTPLKRAQIWRLLSNPCHLQLKKSDGDKKAPEVTHLVPLLWDTTTNIQLLREGQNLWGGKDSWVIYCNSLMSQMTQLMHRKNKRLAQGNTVSHCQSWGISPQCTVPTSQRWCSWSFSCYYFIFYFISMVWNLTVYELEEMKARY